jgi:dynamin 1-like protein
MENVIKLCIQAQHKSKRFPRLMNKIQDVMMKLLKQRFPKTNKCIKELIDVELSCINTNHPDFSIQEALKEYQQLEKHSKYVQKFLINFNKLIKWFFSYNDLVRVVKETDEEFRSRKVERDATVIEKLVREYFTLEKKKIEDSIPKIIMFILVNYMKENARFELDAALKDVDNLLDESEDVTNKREEAELKLEKLREAEEIIDTVYDSAIYL